MLDMHPVASWDWISLTLKRQFTQKMTNLSIFPQPQVIPKPFFCWTQKKIFWSNVGNQTADGPHWLQQFFFSILWKSLANSNCLVTNILQTSSFVFSRRKKLLQVSNFRVSEWWQNCLVLQGWRIIVDQNLEMSSLTEKTHEFHMCKSTCGHMILHMWNVCGFSVRVQHEFTEVRVFLVKFLKQGLWWTEAQDILVYDISPRFHRQGLSQSQTKMHVWAVSTENILLRHILKYVSVIVLCQDAHLNVSF